MEDSAFKTGDAVELVGGSDLMTVKHVDGDMVTVVWTDRRGQPQTETYPAAALRPAQPASGGSIRVRRTD